MYGSPEIDHFENLKVILHQALMRRQCNESSCTQDDYIVISADTSKALAQAGCKESCWMTCLGISYTCIVPCYPCYPLLANKIRCDCTIAIAQNYVKEYKSYNVHDFGFAPNFRAHQNNQDDGYGYYFNPGEDDGRL